MNPKTFCMVPWGHARVGPTGKLHPCCKIKSNFGNGDHDTIDSFDQWWNSSSLRQLRQDLHNGIRNSHCETCWREEDAGNQSLRQNYNRQFAKYLDLRQLDTESWQANSLPVGLDINFNSTCNLKCVMCNPMDSTKIKDEYRLYEEKYSSLTFLQDNPKKFTADQPRDKNETACQQLIFRCAPNLKMIEIKGGEPFLIRQAVSTITDLPNKADIILSINTNGTIDMPDRLFECLSQYRMVWLKVSVDGVDQIGEYVRFGSSWNKVKQNIDRYKTLPNCLFQLSYVLDFFSTVSFPGLFVWAKENYLEFDMMSVIGMPFLSINAVLPERMARFQDWTQQQLRQYPDDPSLKFVQGHLKNYRFDPELHDQCKQYVATLDSIRKNSLPQIQDLFRTV